VLEYRLGGTGNLKIAYLDCFSGISGDMCLGALVDAGAPLTLLAKELKKISITGYELISKKVTRSHFRATKVDVLQKSKGGIPEQKAIVWKDIEDIIQSSKLTEDIRRKGLRIFKRLFEAEARVHGKSFHTVHLHELGAVDCIADIFGTIIGLDLLGIEKVYTSPVNLGSGFVNTEHGMLPVPAPATAEILKKIPVYSQSMGSELTTPTGAAILRELASGFGGMPCMDIEKIGIGAGTKTFNHWPNVLRIFIGMTSAPPLSEGSAGVNGQIEKKGLPEETVSVIETNIDDMNPQIFEYVMERLFRAGALDVFLTQIIMKKGRPGVKMTVLCDEKQRENLISIILKETSTIGLRFYETKRKVMQREIKTVESKFGHVRVKISKSGDTILKTVPEYEDCKKIAKKLNLPLIEILKKI
jgi:pyridinium-3,5-bisthiocarboxylic acid mononucleotide nickel chelatase